MIGGVERDLRRYALADRKVPAIAIPHPSSRGFRPQQWHPVFRAFRELE